MKVDSFDISFIKSRNFLWLFESSAEEWACEKLISGNILKGNRVKEIIGIFSKREKKNCEKKIAEAFWYNHLITLKKAAQKIFFLQDLRFENLTSHLNRIKDNISKINLSLIARVEKVNQ